MTALAPTPERIAGCLEVHRLGGDLARLAAVCEDQAPRYQGVARQRLVDSAAALSWAQRLLHEIEKLEEEDGG